MLLNMVMFKVTICDFGKMNINMTPKTKKAYQKKQILPPPLQKKNLSLQQDFYNLYHEGFKILQIITKT